MQLKQWKTFLSHFSVLSGREKVLFFRTSAWTKCSHVAVALNNRLIALMSFSIPLGNGFSFRSSHSSLGFYLSAIFMIFGCLQMKLIHWSEFIDARHTSWWKTIHHVIFMDHIHLTYRAPFRRLTHTHQCGDRPNIYLHFCALTRN